MANDLACILHCGRISHTRGLCGSCYSRAFKSIKAGETTWAELEKAGHAAPKKPRNNNWWAGKTENRHG